MMDGRTSPIEHSLESDASNNSATVKSRSPLIKYKYDKDTKDFLSVCLGAIRKQVHRYEKGSSKSKDTIYYIFWDAFHRYCEDEQTDNTKKNSSGKVLIVQINNFLAVAKKAQQKLSSKSAYYRFFPDEESKLYQFLLDLNELRQHDKCSADEFNQLLQRLLSPLVAHDYKISLKPGETIVHYIKKSEILLKEQEDTSGASYSLDFSDRLNMAKSIVENRLNSLSQHKISRSFVEVLRARLGYFKAINVEPTVENMRDYFGQMPLTCDAEFYRKYRQSLSAAYLGTEPVLAKQVLMKEFGKDLNIMGYLVEMSVVPVADMSNVGCCGFFSGSEKVYAEEISTTIPITRD